VEILSKIVVHNASHRPERALRRSCAGRTRSATCL
jgi:hypothetical protein